ncbi:MAG: NAD-glutamate dehydrogenase [Gammaproteobacteria bacterium]|nr:NAD-glutamate dehydrogenase [Gammaproteobacteria bacterium]
MGTQRSDVREALLNAAHAMAKERLGEAGTAFETFLAKYYAGVETADLATRASEDLYGGALAHWRFAEHRSPGEIRLRLYTPRPEEHGWQSTHTVVELAMDDMPFLVDSVRMAINRHGGAIHLTIHPIIRVKRSAHGVLQNTLDWEDTASQDLGAQDLGAQDTGAEAVMPEAIMPEAIMLFEIDCLEHKAELAALREKIMQALHAVSVAVADWQAMRGKMQAVIDSLRASPPPLPAAEIEEGIAFLEWLLDDHFIYLGYREHQLCRDDGGLYLNWGPEPGLGIHRKIRAGKRSASFDALPDSVKTEAATPELIVISKANQRSLIHRPGYMDYVGIKRLDEDGNVRAEYRFVGLYTSAPYNRSPQHIPLLRRKVAAVTDGAGYPPNSHADKALLNILENYPRDLVFQLGGEALGEAALAVLHMQERPRIRLIVHPDRFGRFAACVVYVPRERFRTELRLAIQDILAHTLGGEAVDFTVRLSDSVLARLYFLVELKTPGQPEVDTQTLEGQLQELARTWTDQLREAVIEHFGEARAVALLQRYGQAFRASYREVYPPRLAVRDIEHMESLNGGAGIAMSLYRPLEAGESMLQFKLFQPRRPVPLSDALPVLENMGLRTIEEHPTKIKRQGASRIYLHDFVLSHSENAPLDLALVRDKFAETFAHVWSGLAENDGFNRLVLRAALDCRGIVMLRAYCKFLRQIRLTYSQAYMEQALCANPTIAALLVALFKTRFDPALAPQARDASASDLKEQLTAALDRVANLDEDRILRGFLSAVLATVRTNYFMRGNDGQALPYLSLKFDCSALGELPEPKPLYEIFVYSPRIEGIHLRGAQVARGGLRWSDRPEDFRTEILGLVKAQMVKNAVIVPMGSKGGFVPKRLPADSGEAQAEGIACYRIFISGLLDITDNLAAGKTIPPANVVRHDGDDPYLVVAADKGTATFSDIANEIANSRGFWLGDAFASGGSAGYDHKSMGITARGAWESVKRHFRALNLDTQSESFTVIGIGDMGGDVFGNSMLLSPHIKLLGAFNHLHIFLDPAPDTAVSCNERKRLFELPGSTWDHYARELISPGGGVFSRQDKAVALSPQMAAVLDIEPGNYAPNELIHRMLKAPVDLLWNGGIGTYVKASTELHSEADDRANDSVRADGSELRCRVVGEGGNLGLTQRARIEFAQRGGRINTDAIDNSGGVDCSDREVNIKVLLNAVVANGDMTVKQRDTLLSEMTGEVAELVLANNYQQTQALALAEAQAADMLDVHARLIQFLEKEARLNRVIEALPDGEELQLRRNNNAGLTAPELSVLLAYAKIHLYQQLVASALADDDCVREELAAYFPTPLRKRFAVEIQRHQLRNEISATILANEVINRGGMTFPFRLREETGADYADLIRAYAAARKIYAMRAFWSDVEALDNAAPAPIQVSMLLEGRRLLERAARWLLRHCASPLPVAQIVADYATDVADLMERLSSLLPAPILDTVARRSTLYAHAGVPQAVAQRAALMTELYAVLDIVNIAREAQESAARIGAIYFALYERLSLGWLRDRMIALPRNNRWQTLSRAAIRDELYAQTAELTRAVLRTSPESDNPHERVEIWVNIHARTVERYRQLLTDLMAAPTPDFTMLSVIMRELRLLDAAKT